MYDYTKKTKLVPGQKVKLLLPYSEVCMHMKVSDKVMDAEMLPENRYFSVQLYREDGTEFSAPITYGEAGVFRDDEGFYYYPHT